MGWKFFNSSGQEIVSTVATVANSSITDAKVATGIDAVKLADGTVTNAELQFINSLSSNAQTQLSAKASASGLTVVENDIKQLIVTTGFLSLRVAALASLSKYNLGDLFIDDIGGVIRANSPEAQELLASSNFFNMIIAVV